MSQFISLWDALAQGEDYSAPLDGDKTIDVAIVGGGISTGTVFGRIMAQLLTGMNRADLPLPITDVAPVPNGGFLSRNCQTGFTANQFLKSF